MAQGWNSKILASLKTTLLYTSITNQLQIAGALATMNQCCNKSSSMCRVCHKVEWSYQPWLNVHGCLPVLPWPVQWHSYRPNKRLTWPVNVQGVPCLNTPQTHCSPLVFTTFLATIWYICQSLTEQNACIGLPSPRNTQHTQPVVATSRMAFCLFKYTFHSSSMKRRD